VGTVAQGASPAIAIERIDAEMITRYISNCSSFRAKASVYATLSTMRGFGDYLAREGLWKINPLRWMKGPKVTPYSHLRKRIDHAHMEAMWREAANRHGCASPEFHAHRKLTRFPAATAVPFRLSLHPRAPETCPPRNPERYTCIYKDEGTRTFARRYVGSD
jgi:hypothetical protein